LPDTPPLIFSLFSPCFRHFTLPHYVIDYLAPLIFSPLFSCHYAFIISPLLMPLFSFAFIDIFIFLHFISFHFDDIIDYFLRLLSYFHIISLFFIDIILQQKLISFSCQPHPAFEYIAIFFHSQLQPATPLAFSVFFRYCWLAASCFQLSRQPGEASAITRFVSYAEPDASFRLASCIRYAS